MEQGETVEVAVETKDEIGRLAQSFNRMAAGIAERERRITQLAFNDSLTGLPNRAFFRQHLDLELQQARAARGGSLALLCVDLDNFKAVNDTLGHPVGDELLRAVGRPPRRAVSATPLVARLGGDEFTVILSARRRARGRRRRARTADRRARRAVRRSTATSSPSAPASASRSRPATAPTPTPCSSMPTSRSIRRRRKAAAPIASSRPR